jgi:hypothetical protein
MTKETGEDRYRVLDNRAEGQIYQFGQLYYAARKYMTKQKERTHSTGSRRRVIGPCCTAGSALLRRNERHCSPDGGNKPEEDERNAGTDYIGQ